MAKHRVILTRGCSPTPHYDSLEPRPRHQSGSAGLCGTIRVSRFTRGTLYYGERLVYEALTSKWDLHDGNYCGCVGDWVSAHAEPAGFKVVRDGGGFVAPVRPALTEGVDEPHLTANAIWEATGKPGGQTWFDEVKVIDRPQRRKRGT